MIRMSRYGFIYLLTVIFAVTFLTLPVFADDDNDDNYYHGKTEHELVCDGDEPKLLNPKTGRLKKILNPIHRALAREICELKAFNEACNPEKTVCDGNCTDTNTDPNNCGECKNVCPTGICDNGECVNEGDPCNDGNDCTENDRINVSGICTGDPVINGSPCGNEGECVDGECQEEDGCQSGLIKCGSDCVDILINPNHCGRCNQRCPQGQECVGGNCVQPGNTGTLQINWTVSDDNQLACDTNLLVTLYLNGDPAADANCRDGIIVIEGLNPGEYVARLSLHDMGAPYGEVPSFYIIIDEGQTTMETVNFGFP